MILNSFFHQTLNRYFSYIGNKEKKIRKIWSLKVYSNLNFSEFWGRIYYGNLSCTGLRTAHTGDMMGIRRKQAFLLITLDNCNELLKKNVPGSFNFPVVCLSTKNKEWTKLNEIYIQGHELILVKFVDDCFHRREFVVSKKILNNNRSNNNLNIYFNTIWVKLTDLLLGSRI